MTESTNINSLADHHIWSTIKTLPATLPEPSSMDRGPRTGVTGAVSASDLHLCEGVGPQGADVGSWIADLGRWIDRGRGGMNLAQVEAIVAEIIASTIYFINTG